MGADLGELVGCLDYAGGEEGVWVGGWGLASSERFKCMTRESRVALRRGVLALERRTAVCGDYQSEIHEASDEDFVVLEDVEDVGESDLALNGGAALVLLQAGFDVRALVFAEPGGVFGEIGDEEEEEDGDDAGESALEDEDPAPA